METNNSQEKFSERLTTQELCKISNRLKFQLEHTQEDQNTNEQLLPSQLSHQSTARILTDTVISGVQNQSDPSQVKFQPSSLTQTVVEVNTTTPNAVSAFQTPQVNKHNPHIQKSATQQKERDMFNLANDMQSFDILWFDLITKTRQLVQEVCQPIVERVHQHKNVIGQIHKLDEEQNKRIQMLENIVLQKDQKLDVFEQIYDKIAQIDLERRQQCMQLSQRQDQAQQNIDAFEFKLQNNDKLLSSMVGYNITIKFSFLILLFQQQHNDQALQELSDLKEKLQQSTEDIIDKMTSQNHQVLISLDEIREKTTQLEFQMNSKSAKLATIENITQEMYQRLQTVEKLVDNQNAKLLQLENIKHDKSHFQKEISEVHDTLREHFKQIFDNQNHCQTLENYIEKYQSIRVQNLISETITAVVGSKERKRLEIYDSEKMALLYKVVLEDHGIGNVQRLIIQLNEKAKKEVEEDEKKKKRRFAINDLTKVSFDKSIIRGKTNYLLMKIFHIESMEKSEDSIKSNSTKKKGGSELLQQETKLQQQFSSISQSPAGDDNFNYKLTELVNSEFDISEEDPDFELSQEQLCKVMKIFLYKMNLVKKYQQQENAELSKAIEEKFQASERYTRSIFEEVNQFLQTVHVDFENFLKKHKKEHADISTKLSSVLDINTVNQELISEVRGVVEHYATVLSCLVEYNNVEQALALQDELDRQNIQLMGHKQVLKGDGLNQTQANLANVVANVTGSPNTLLNKITVGGGNMNLASQGMKSTYRSRFSGQTGLSIKFKNSSIAPDDPGSLSQRDHANGTAGGFSNYLDNSVLQLDQQCLSCSGFSTNVLKQFKLACLSYAPSKVTYRNEIFSRYNLMQMRKTLLDKCEEIVNELQWPFNIKGLKTQKVFKDLLQYFFETQKANTFNSSNQNPNKSMAIPFGDYDSRQQSHQKTVFRNNSFMGGTSNINNTSVTHIRQNSEPGEQQSSTLLKAKQLQQQHHQIPQTTPNLSILGQQHQPSYHIRQMKTTIGSAIGNSRNPNKQAVDNQSNDKRYATVQSQAKTPALNLPSINI